MGTKEQLLALFEQNRGIFISGEKIASDLGLSRTAVWKAVNSLRNEGHEISAVTNRGYCLAEDSDVLSVQGIQHYLSDECSFIRPEIFSCVGSTNMICRNKANDGEEEGYVAVAGCQTGGRGRRGRSFFSPSETGLYMSILLKPGDHLNDEVLGITTMAAVAACEAIEAVSGRSCQIKWVNDILLNGRKVCGILTEASFALEDQRLFAVVAGIGINVYPPKEGFPDDIKDIAGSIFERSESGKRNRLAAEMINHFMAYYMSDDKKRYIDEYRRRSVVIGREIDVIKRDGIRHAYAEDLDENCGLVVRYDDGSTESLNYGEVSIKGLY